jgi:putative peptide zinc metalloprotease protein
MASMSQTAAAAPLDESGSGSRWPVFRRDLEVVPRTAAGDSGGFVIRDPRSGASFEMDEKEFYLCGQLDGHNAPEAIRSRFQQRFSRPLGKAEFDDFLRLVERQGLLAPNGAPAVPRDFEPFPGAFLEAPRWLEIDRIFGWVAERVRWCFSPAFSVFAVSLVALSAGVLIKHWRLYGREWGALVKGDFPVLLVVGVFLFLSFLQKVSAGIACKYAGGRVRWFGLKLLWYFYPVFQCDLSDTGWMWHRRNLYRTIYVGFVAQLLLGAWATIAWYTIPMHTGLRTFFLVLSTILLTFLPWNPLGPRNGYYLFSAWLEIPELRTRSLHAVWSWFTGTPPLEPLTRRRKWGFRLYGVLTILFFGFLGVVVCDKVGALLIQHIDITGTALVVVVGAFFVELPLRKELMRFEPFYLWLARNDGRSALGWTIRLSLAAILLIALFLPYPYEPGGKLRILPGKQVGVRTQVQGKISEVMVQEGQWVKKGELIARLDARDARKNLEVNEAELERNRSQLALLEAGSKPEEIAQAREKVATAEKELYYNTREAERLEKLHAQKVVSLGLYERALEQRDVSKGMHDTAVENLNLVMSGARKEALDSQRAEVERLEAEVRHSQEDLKLTEIVAPAAGRIVTPRIQEHVGMEVLVGDLIASIEDAHSLLAEAEVPEKTAGDIKPGARVKVKAWAYPNRLFIGRVAHVAPVVLNKKKQGMIEYLHTEREDALSRATTSDEGRVVRVLVKIPNPDGLLKSEMTGYAKVFTKYEPFGLVMTHGLARFFRIEVWSWIP